MHRRGAGDRRAGRAALTLRLSDFDYVLPEELIAQAPLAARDASRLLVLDHARPELEHRTFADVLAYLRPGDLLVANDARVIPARLLGKKVGSGGRVELLLCEPIEGGARWRALGQASKGLKAGQWIRFGDGRLEAEVAASLGEGSYEVRLVADDVPAAIAQVGQVPLPPYIRRAPSGSDLERYQTVYAARPVAAAAPTAGLHFTPGLLERIAQAGVGFARLTLHVGPGTFLPVRVDDVRDHAMHAERFAIPEATAEAIARTRRAGGRVIAVGTTSVRALESAALPDGTVRPGEGCATLFIYPGHLLRIADALITNFHLPKSTLLMLVSAFAGRERILAAYAEAVRRRYRFFSYGDAMLIL